MAHQQKGKKQKIVSNTKMKGKMRRTNTKTWRNNQKEPRIATRAVHPSDHQEEPKTTTCLQNIQKEQNDHQEELKTMIFLQATMMVQFSLIIPTMIGLRARTSYTKTNLLFVGKKAIHL